MGMMIKILFFCLTCFVVNATSDTPSRYATEMDFISKLGKEAIDTLTCKELSDDERKRRFEVIFIKDFAVEKIAHFTLGRYAKKTTPEERTEFLELFKKTIADIYAQRFKNYDNEQFKVENARALSPQTVLVKSKIVRPSGDPIDVDWKIVRDPEANIKIGDVIVEGISMSVTQRSDFTATIQNHGGKVSDLNRVLQNKLNAPS